MSLNESIAEDAALEWFGKLGSGRSSRPVNRRRSGELNVAPLDSKPEAAR